MQLLPKEKSNPANTAEETEETLKISVAIDWDNLLLNLMDSFGPDKKISMQSCFEKLISWLEKRGEVAHVVVFAPPESLSMIHRDIIYKYGFFLVTCGKVIEKGDKGKFTTRDIVDETLIKFVDSFIIHNYTINAFCLVSGDDDFSEMIKRLKQDNKKIFIGAPSINSLSRNLVALAEPSKEDPEKRTVLRLDIP